MLCPCVKIHQVCIKGCKHSQGVPDALAKEFERGRLPAQVAYLDLARMRLRPECGLLHAGPAACLAGRLNLLPGIMGAPAQVLPKAQLLSVLTHSLVCCNVPHLTAWCVAFFSYCAYAHL